MSLPSVSLVTYSPGPESLSLNASGPDSSGGLPISPPACSEDLAEKNQAEQACVCQMENISQLGTASTDACAIEELSSVSKSDKMMPDKYDRNLLHDREDMVGNKERETVEAKIPEVLDDDSDTITDTVENVDEIEEKTKKDLTNPNRDEDGVQSSAEGTSVSLATISPEASSQLYSSAHGSMRCTASGCRHLSHSQAGLILHLGTHYKFEVSSESKSGETKFSYINGKYLCSLCPLVTFNRTVFGEHIRHHLLSHPYKCGHCGEGVESLVHLRQHNRIAHRQLLVKLVINKSAQIDSLMSRLGPQAPPTSCKLKSDLNHVDASTDAADPICIDDDGEESSDISKTTQVERKEPLNQNFKYSLTKDGRLLCAQCKYMTPDVDQFGIHVFNDIHHALKNPCGKCNQRGKQSVVMQHCIIVDQIMRALVRQKELQNVPKEGQETVLRDVTKTTGEGNGFDSVTINQHTSVGMSQKGQPPKDAEKMALPKSPFEETMALLRTLSSDNQCDGICSTDPKLSYGEEASPPFEQGEILEKSASAESGNVEIKAKDTDATTLGLAEKEPACRSAKSARELDIAVDEQRQKKISEKEEENTGLKGEKIPDLKNLAGREEASVMRTESHLPEDKSGRTVDNLRDDSCCRCMVYKAKPRRHTTLEELDKKLKEKMDLDARSESNSSTLYRCGIPGCMFTNSLDLNFKLHCMVRHPGMAALTCSLCQKGFENEDLLLDHINCEHNQGLGSPVEKGIYLCSVEHCGLSFNRIVELKAHFVTNHPHLGNFPCSFCFESVPAVDGIMTHIQTHLVNVMKCSYCKKVFNEKDELLGHISSSHEGQPKKINICIKVVNNSRSKLTPDGQSKEEPPCPSAETDKAATERKSLTGLLTPPEKGVSVMHEEAKKDIKEKCLKRKHEVQGQGCCVREVAEGDDDVELMAAKDDLSVRCEQCTFTCNTQLQLKVHVYECHTKEPTRGLLFACKWCKMATDVKETLQKHIAHHTGKNTVRYYVCPYCSKQSNQMDLIEEHVMNDHTNEPFKFEVLQDLITYLQNMIICPVCKGGFTWKEDFLHHLGSVHRLEDLVLHLEANIPEKPFMQSYKVPRHFFKDLLPASARLTSLEIVAKRSKGESGVRDAVRESKKSTSEGASEFGKDGMILRFHCEICEFSINDYPKYREHMALTHGNILDGENSGMNRSASASAASNVIFNGSVGFNSSISDLRPKQMKFSCPLCPFECNKTLNYRRHLAIHERTKEMTDGFKCGYCKFLHDRQNCIKFHLGKYHGHLPPKICRIVAGVEVDVSSDDSLMRSSRNNHLQKNSAPDVSRVKRALKQVSRWSASWETPYSFTGRSRRFFRDSRRFISRTMDNIAADYMESDLPAGMIYPEPVKCPKCQFSNRVRINLVRHMKLHQNDGDIGMVDENPEETNMSNISGSLGQPGTEHSRSSAAAAAPEKDSIKIEAIENAFNFQGAGDVHNLSRRSSITHTESIRCPSARSELSISDNCVASSESDLDLGDEQGRLSCSGSIDMDLGNSKKLFKCCYCSIISKWNRRDISLHILHVHMQKRVYSCQYCSYGSSKSSAIVMNHCNKIHPQKKICVRDELALFNAIMPIQEGSGVVPVALLRPNGVPILDLTELRHYVSINGSTSQGEPVTVEKRTSAELLCSSIPTSKRSLVEDDRDQPLDLSVKIRASCETEGAAFGKDVANSFKEADYGGNSGVEFVEWKCKLCRFRNRSANHVKRHILCHHMRLKPFSCPYCCLYQWKAQAVASHIEKFHPGQPKTPVSTANEKAPYLSRNMTRVFVRPGTVSEEENRSRATVPSTSGTDHSQFTGVCSTSFYRCKQCGFQEVRHDKTKYHVIKQHLKLGLFSCPYCRKYMWGRNYVARHIRSTHPGQEVKIQRTFDEYAAYLRDNIKKIGGSTVESTRTQFPALHQEYTMARESPVEQAPLSSPNHLASSASSCKKMQRCYICYYCNFKHSLAAKVQSHCLTRHPTKPVRYRDNTPDDGKQIKVELTDDEEDRGNQAAKTPSREVPIHRQRTPSPAVKTHLPIEMYMCRYCHHLLWNMEEMMAHLCESHPDEPPEFELMQEPSGSLPLADDSTPPLFNTPMGNDRSEVPNSFADKAVNLFHKNKEDDGNSHILEEDDNDDDAESSKRSNRSSPLDPDLIFKCRLCNYHTDKVTVMRHHVMSHLLYHPYRCPYCDQAHSVKSSPITKHIRLKHPGMEAQFSCDRDEEMERQVRSTYYRTVRDGTESTVPVKSFRKSFTIPLTPKMRKLSRRAFYKCKFCGLVTHIRTDMKHHLMREIHYKPFLCGYCNYTEPSRSGMGKHFRSKHCGMVVDIRTTHDPEEDTRVEKMLEECVTRHNPDNVNSATTHTEFTRRNEPFKLLTKKIPSTEATLMHGSGVNIFSHGNTHGNTHGPLPGLSVPHGRAQKSFTLSKMPKLHHCSQCSYTSISLRPLQAHMVKHRPARLQCGYCSHRSHYPSWIRKHIRSSHPGFPFKYCKAAAGPKLSAADVKHEISFDDPPAASLSPVPSPPTPPTITPPPPQVSRVAPNYPALGKKLQKLVQGPALLDGVELDITLVADRDGYYRCPQCDYQTANRSHYKMHSVIHRPRKWKCFYCSHKFPLIFRLRRHSSLKHPQLPVKWVDVVTEQVCDDSTRIHPSRRQLSSGNYKTARKSAKRQSALTVEVLSSYKAKPAKCSAQSSDETTIDLELESSRSQVSTELDSDEDPTSQLWYCCPSCPKKYTLLSLFADHLRSEHTAPARFPILEILPPMGEGELTLQRCGFCPYESFFKEDFDNHVKGHTSLQPSKCNHCQFASFVVTDLESHHHEHHPHLPLGFSDLDQPYTMTSDVPAIPDQRVTYNFSPIVKLVDVCKILQDKWDVV